jgi:plasmid stability protein
MLRAARAGKAAETETRLIRQQALQYLDAGIHNLGAYAVAGQEDYLE